MEKLLLYDCERKKMEIIKAIGVRNLHAAPGHEKGYSDAKRNAGKLDNFPLNTPDSSDRSDEDAKSVLSEKVSPAHMQFVTSFRSNGSEFLCNAYL
eukprot:scaffold32178_cov54-Attheya_sp.AAC.4